ncbi:MAG: pentapeptide repeat-containing protein [Acidobacteriota bacterium]
MANPEHLAKLREGVDTWNQWRQENPNVKPELAGARLVWMDLSKCNLSATDLSAATLGGATLSEANLSAARLSGAELSEANLRGASLMVAHLSRARLVEADLTNANLTGADFTGADLRGADLTEAVVSATKFRWAKLTLAKLAGVDLDTAHGVLLDRNELLGMKFRPRCRDLWSVLRRNYTGPRLLFHLLLLVAFVGPYAAETAMWLLLSTAEVKVPHLVEAAFGPETGPIEDWEVTTVGSLLLDRHRGLLAHVLAVVLLVYNILRAVLTANVGPLREEEGRTQHTPPWARGGRGQEVISGYFPCTDCSKFCWLSPPAPSPTMPGTGSQPRSGCHRGSFKQTGTVLRFSRPVYWRERRGLAMGNPEQLLWLKQGVAAWHQWRLIYPRVVPELRGADLSGTDLTGADLTRVSLTRADLTGANGTEHRSAEPGGPVDFDSVETGRLDRLWDWEHMRVLGRLPLFGVSYLALILVPAMMFLLAFYNVRVADLNELGEEVAGALQGYPATTSKELVQPDALLAVADFLRGAETQAVPSQSFLLLVSTVLLAMASTTYTLACPSRVKEFG